MGALETLQAKFNCQLLLVESGGDNLAANYSRELADYIIYVIDVSVSDCQCMRILPDWDLISFLGRRQNPSQRWTGGDSIRLTCR